MNNLQAILTFIGGLFAGYVASFFKHEFDKEKSRFDFKTKMLREVWEAVVYCKSLAANLSPQMDLNGIEGESWQQRRDRLLPEFYKAHLDAKRVVRFNPPFYPKSLHDLANRVLLESWSEARYFQQLSPDNSSNYWEKSGEKIKVINQLADELCEAIRADVDTRMPQWMRSRVRLKDSSTISC